MRARLCAACFQALPVRVVSNAIRVNGRRYLTCSRGCTATLLRLHAEASPPQNASDVFDRLRGHDFGPAKPAVGTTAVAERAEVNMRTAATRTARIGRPAYAHNRTPAPLTRLTYCRNNEEQAPACPVVACPCCAGRGVAVRCDHCNGTGVWVVYTERESIQAHVPRTIRCSTCDGKGYMPVEESLLEARGFR